MMKMCDLAVLALRSFICRNRYERYTLLVLLILLLRVSTQGQSDSTIISPMGQLPIEWLVESLSSDELSELEPDHLIELARLSDDSNRQLLDLNRATMGEIRARLPFLTSYQLYQLRRYRDERGGELHSVYDLKWISGWDRETIARVAPHVTVRPLSKVEYEKLPSQLSGGAYLSVSYGNPTGGVGKSWYDPCKLRSGIALRQKDHWRVAVQYQRYPQEPIKYGSWRYLLEYEPKSTHIDKIILGYFKVHWGAGLLSSSSIWTSTTAPELRSYHRATVTPSLSAMREQTLRGIATQGRWGACSYSAFYSYTLLDGLLDERRSLVEAIRPNMRYDTPERQAQRSLIPMQTVGAQVAYGWDRANLSLQTLYADWMSYSLAFMPGYKALQTATPLQDHWLSSLSYHWQSNSRRLQLDGELALEHLTHWGAIQHIRYHTAQQRTLGVTLYYMSPFFTSFYGRAVSHYTPLGNDVGLHLYGTTRLRDRTTLQTLVELYQSIRPRYRQAERSRGIQTKLYLTMRYRDQLEQLWYAQLGMSDQERLRWRLSSMLRYNLLPLSIQLVGTLQRRLPYEQADAQWGRAITLLGQYHLARIKQLSVVLSGHYYDTDHQRVASYAYMPTTRYAVSLYRAVGRGVVSALRMQWRGDEHWILSAAIRYDHNSDLGSRSWCSDCYLSYRF